MFQVPPQVNAGYQQAKGRIAELWGQRPQVLKDNPLLLPAAGLGAVAANNALGNPVGGAIDALTFGATNFKDDGGSDIGTPIILGGAPGSSVVVSDSTSSSPGVGFTLNADDRKRQMDNLRRKIATDMVTLQSLQIQQAGEQNAR